MAYLSLLISCLVIVISSKQEHEAVFDWDQYTIRASCALESSLSEGEYDEQKLESCRDCFQDIATVPTWEGSELVVNCSSIHLPNIAGNCSAELGEDVVFETFWESAKKCFYDFVKMSGLYEQIREDVRKTMEDNESKDELDWGTYLIVTSCALETLLPDGEYDDEAADNCMSCFDHNMLGEGPAGVRSCAGEHLPRIS